MPILGDGAVQCTQLGRHKPFHSTSTDSGADKARRLQDVPFESHYNTQSASERFTLEKQHDNIRPPPIEVGQGRWISGSQYGRLHRDDAPPTIHLGDDAGRARDGVAGGNKEGAQERKRNGAQ